MNTKLLTSALVAGALLLPVTGFGADSIVTSPKAFVKDSVITTKIKSKLATEEKPSTLVKISVDTDDKGMVVLSGTAPTQAAADRAVMIAKATEGVKMVDSKITIKADN